LVRLRNLLVEADSRCQKIADEEAQTNREITEKVAGIMYEISTADQDRIQAQQLAVKIADLETEISSLSRNKCPTCEQTWATAAARLSKAEADVVSLANTKVILDASAARLPELKEKLAEAKSRTVVSKLSRMVELKAKLTVQINELIVGQQNEHNKEITVMLAAYDQPFRFDQEEKMLEIEREISRTAAELATLMGQLNQQLEINSKIEKGFAIALERYESRQREILASLKAVEDAKNKVIDLDVAWRRETEFIKAMGRTGFLGTIFDEILAEISDETNKILARVPNVSHVTVTFESDLMTQKNVHKKVIVPAISVNGKRAPLESGLSGGMLSSVELAVDLALGEVISRRSGVKVGWLVLDECFEGMGLEDKEGCMDILKQYSGDKLIIIVDHASEFKEQFDQVVEIARREHGGDF
jgi:DNA repair exonuclease SbcCD ATPase subunit